MHTKLPDGSLAVYRSENECGIYEAKRAVWRKVATDKILAARSLEELKDVLLDIIDHTAI